MRATNAFASAMVLFLALSAGLGTPRPAGAGVTVTISCSSLGQESELCRSGAEAWAAQTGNAIKLVSTPADANERLSLYQTLLAAHSADIDVLQIDIIWPGILAPHFVDLTKYIPADSLSDHFPQLLKNNRVNGRLIAIPWFVDAGLLYYRRDLLEKYDRAVPRSWAELTDTAATITAAERAAGNVELEGFVWQGRAYEGLTCNALEWIASAGGGRIVEPDGTVSIDNPRAVRALELARSWLGHISPVGVLNYAEEETRGAFQSGRAVFMRNWPYAWALVNSQGSPVKGKVGLAPLPSGTAADGLHAATLGGQQLAVSRYSAHPDVAASLVRYLTGRAEQKRRALAASFNPTRRSLYEDEALRAANPFYADFYVVLQNAVARPSAVTGRHYNRVSSEFVRAVHATLSGRGGAEANLAGLARVLERLSHGSR
jgi:trehalose/maltose transport system substrate-binding protein